MAGFLTPLLVAFVFACNLLNPAQVRTYVQEPFPEKLSAWHLFWVIAGGLEPNSGVVPYDLNTPLFTDYASKHRFVWMPSGTSAVYHETETFQFPVGTILAKTFAYPVDGAAPKARRERWIETRLLVNTKSGWVGLPYVWNEEQTEATLELAADPTAVRWTHPSGKQLTINYTIPNANQCKSCHADKQKVMKPIGPKARNLNKDFAYADGPANQLAYWTKVGYLKGAPSPDKAPKAAVWNDPKSGSLEARARTYLDVNCAHCHTPEGPANTSGLYLSSTVTEPLRLGLCKVPVSAGQGSGNLLFDVVPGKPDESILVYRMESTTPKVMMPELGRTLEHEEGVALVREWVASLEGECAFRPPGGSPRPAAGSQAAAGRSTRTDQVRGM
jgi:uncharacterized repeat protein (TIGR03806 family)